MSGFQDMTAEEFANFKFPKREPLKIAKHYTSDSEDSESDEEKENIGAGIMEMMSGIFSRAEELRRQGYRSEKAEKETERTRKQET